MSVFYNSQRLLKFDDLIHIIYIYNRSFVSKFKQSENTSVIEAQNEPPTSLFKGYAFERKRVCLLYLKLQPKTQRKQRTSVSWKKFLARNSNIAAAKAKLFEMNMKNQVIKNK